MVYTKMGLKLKLRWYTAVLSSFTEETEIELASFYISRIRTGF